VPAAHPALLCGVLAQLKFQLGEAGENAGHHATRSVRRVDALA
jgi:hypothetical protein